MKTYTTPSLKLLSITKEDILTASGEPVISFNSDSGEYWIGAAADWWGA
ncbi:MAG: hypothetical protein IJ011_04505 [Clostridia bacterium]|nr:hypothetical protein [Clostridia bacterium]